MSIQAGEARPHQYGGPAPVVNSYTPSTEERVLYKYLAPERIDVLRDQRIRFTQPSVLNDPFELQSYFEDIFNRRDIGEQTASKSPTTPRDIEEQHNRLPAIEPRKTSPQAYGKRTLGALRSDQGSRASSGLVGALEVLLQQTEDWMRSGMTTMMDEIGILSLSEDPTNGLMWSHYGASHRGFLIGFDETDTFFNRRRSDTDAFFHLRKVVYRSLTDTTPLARLKVKDVFLSKSPDWSYEREHRMLVPLSQADCFLEHPYGKIHLFSFPPRCVRRVVTGAQSEEAFRVEIGEVVGSMPYEHVEVCYCVLNRRTNRVDLSC